MTPWGWGKFVLFTRAEASFRNPHQSRLLIDRHRAVNMAQPQGYGYPPPVENSYPPSQQPPSQYGGYPPPQQGYPPPQQAGYPPAQPGYAPTQPGYAPPVNQQPGKNSICFAVFVIVFCTPSQLKKPVFFSIIVLKLFLSYFYIRLRLLETENSASCRNGL